MVGHTAIIPACITAAEVLDECVGRLRDIIDQLNGVMIVTSDHGNMDEKLDEKGNPITAHSLNPVPFYIHDPQYAGEYVIDDSSGDTGISSIAAVILQLLGFVPPENYTPSFLQFN